MAILGRGQPFKPKILTVIKFTPPVVVTGTPQFLPLLGVGG